MELLLEKSKPVMLVGNAGVGKTLLIGKCLASLSKDFLVSKVPFNYYTTSATLQSKPPLLLLFRLSLWPLLYSHLSPLWLTLHLLPTLLIWVPLPFYHFCLSSLFNFFLHVKIIRQPKVLYCIFHPISSYSCRITVYWLYLSTLGEDSRQLMSNNEKYLLKNSYIKANQS